jgi:uncharacterized phage infection (PIP) family protein YhgE
VKLLERLTNKFEAENNKLTRTIEKVREDTVQQAKYFETSLRELSARLDKVDASTAAIINGTEVLEVKTRDLSNEVTNVKAHVNKEIEAVKQEITSFRQEMSDERAEWRNEAGEKFSSLHSGIQKLEQETHKRAVQVDSQLREFGNQVIQVREARKSTSPEQNVCQSSCSSEQTRGEGHAPHVQQTACEPLDVRHAFVVNEPHLHDADGRCMQNASTYVSHLTQV